MKRFKTPSGLYKGAVLAFMLGVWMVLASGCAQEYDFERKTPTRGTFGEEIFEIVRKDATISARSAESRAKMLDKERDSFVLALDTMVSDALLRPLEALLRRILPLYDRGLVQEVTRRLAEVLLDCSEDETLRQMWAKPDLEGYQHPSLVKRTALMEHIAAFPDLRAMLQMNNRLVLENDGLSNEGGPNSDEPTFMLDLVAILSDFMIEAEVSNDPFAIKAQATDLLLSHDFRFGAPNADKLWAVRIDHRGKPLVRTNPQGSLHAPFSDRDGDGMADVNDQGQFVNRGGEPLPEILAFEVGGAEGLVSRDDLGRAHQNDDLVFDYIDLNETALAYLLRQNGALLRDEVPFKLVDALIAVMPERVPATDPDTGRAYMGYPEDHPLMDLIHAALLVMGFDSLDELMELTVTMLADHEDAFAEVLLALKEFGELDDTFPEAKLTENNTLVDDLMPLLAEVAQERGLLEAVLNALSDDVALTLERSTLEALRYRADSAAPAPNGPYEQCFKTCSSLAPGTTERIECIWECPRDEILKERVDWNAPPSAGNRSLFERTLALLRESSGVEFEMLVERLIIPELDMEFDVGTMILPPLLRIDDAGAAFIDALAGNLDLEVFVTPEAIESQEIHLMLDGFDFICSDNGFVDRLIARLLPQLIRVTEADLMRTCQAFVGADNDPSLTTEADIRRRKIVSLVSFLSQLTDVPLSSKPSANQLARFFNLPDPSVDLEFMQLTLSKLVDKDGYELWEHNGDMLFAGEATGTLDGLYPVAKAFSDRGRGDLLVDILATLGEHYTPPGVDYLRRKDGSAIPNKGTGVQRFERLLADDSSGWLEQGRIIPALYNLSVISSGLRSSRNTSMEDILAAVTRHIMVPDNSVSHRDGQRTSKRADGTTVELSPGSNDLNRFYVLADALNALTDKLDEDPEARASWDHAVDALIDSALGVKTESRNGPARWIKPGGPALTSAITAQLAKRARTHRNEGKLLDIIKVDYWNDARDLMVGPELPALMDMLQTVASNPDDRELMTNFMLHNVEDQAGIDILLVKTHELLVDIAHQDDFVQNAHYYGELLNPNRTWNSASIDLPLFSAAVLMLSETDAEDQDNVADTLLKAAVTRHPELRDALGDSSGAYPISTLVDVYSHYHRADPSLASWGDDSVPLNAEDYKLICGDMHQWLLDDKRGMEQIFDMIDLRKREP